MNEDAFKITRENVDVYFINDAAEETTDMMQEEESEKKTNQKQKTMYQANEKNVAEVVPVVVDALEIISKNLSA